MDDSETSPATTNGIPGEFFVVAAQVSKSPRGLWRPVPANKQNGATEAAADRPTITFSKGKLSPPAMCIEAGGSIEFKNASPDQIRAELELDHGERRILVPPFVAAELAAIPRSRAPFILRVEGLRGPQCVILSLEHPSKTAIVDAQGHFRIPDLPVGDWGFRFFHREWGRGGGIVDRITRANKDLDVTNGTFFVRVHPGQNDLGEIGLSDKDLEQSGWTWRFSLPWPFGS